MTIQSQPMGHSHVESEHLDNTGSGTIRAGIFGISDGLVSNLALVMGVAGGTDGSASAVVMAGSVGLLAGAFSMAAGEYVSMKTQRESMERQIQLEREHIRDFPEEEQAHLSQLLIQSGIEPDHAQDIAQKLHQNLEPAVGFHALLELGIVPQQMGSPEKAAGTSFVAFVLGALVPLIPWLIFPSALLESILVSGFGLMVVGGAVTAITQRSALWGAIRQLLFGATAAGITWLLGRLVSTAL
ncbi:MAG: VIT1/CCC1 transporter family protein [Myxococcota bacterium]|nr:VIT1/CCC1 transporter family protein [Myxococcota bacterium]